MHVQCHETPNHQELETSVHINYFSTLSKLYLLRSRPAEFSRTGIKEHTGLCSFSDML